MIENGNLFLPKIIFVCNTQYSQRSPCGFITFLITKGKGDFKTVSMPFSYSFFINEQSKLINSMNKLI